MMDKDMTDDEIRKGSGGIPDDEIRKGPGGIPDDEIRKGPGGIPDDEIRRAFEGIPDFPPIPNFEKKRDKPRYILSAGGSSDFVYRD